MTQYIGLIKEIYYLLQRVLDLFKKTPEEKRADLLKEIQLVFNSEKLKSGDTSEIEDIINKRL